MKIYLFFFSLVSAVIFLGACSEDVLNKEPTEPTEVDFFQTQTDVERTVFAAYAKLTDVYWYNANNPNHQFWMLPGDDVTPNGANPFENFGGLTAGNARLSSIYNAYYQMIRRSYTALEKINEWQSLYQTPGLNEANQGEAWFLIGYANFRIWNYWGQYAPIVSTRVQDEALVNQGPPLDNSMLDSAINQMQRALALVPEEWDATNVGRIDKQTVRGMLGKALVFRASYFGSASDWTQAITLFSSINGKQLVDDYAANFDAFDENNDESLFEFQASSAPGGTDNIWLRNDFNQAVGSMSAYWGFYPGIPAWIQGVPFRPTAKVVAAFNGNDGRLGESIDTTNNQFIKYVAPGRNQAAKGGNGTSENNPRILRYADVLLLWAEALVESGGSTSQAIDLINQVRTRARNNGGTGFPTDYSTAETDRNVIHGWIRNERFIELAGEEGHRWDDLRRWHAAGKINLANWEPTWTSGETGFSSTTNLNAWDFELPRNLLYPIPQSEIDFNVNALQNENY